MGLFDRFKKRELTALPPLEDLQELPDDIPNLSPDSPLPDWPTMPEQQDFPESPEPIEIREVSQPKQMIMPPPMPKNTPQQQAIQKRDDASPRQEIKEVRKIASKVALPQYIKVDAFQKMLKGVQEVKDRIQHCGQLAEKLNQVKELEDKELEKYRAKLEDMQRKLIYVDKILYESKGES